MDDIGRKLDTSECALPSGETSIESPAARCYFPPWMREQLIQQFQGIDRSSRSEAMGQIEAYERNFLAIFASNTDS